MRLPGLLLLGGLLLGCGFAPLPGEEEPGGLLGLLALRLPCGQLADPGPIVLLDEADLLILGLLAEPPP